MTGGEGDVIVEGEGLLVAVDGEFEGGAGRGCEWFDCHIDSRRGLGSYLYIRNSQVGRLARMICRGVFRRFRIKRDVELA